MKKLGLLLLMLFLSASISMAQRRAKTPIKLLKIIYKLAEAKKYNKLKKFLYDGKITDGSSEMENKSVSDMILYGIKNQKKRGDFSYNAQGLKLLIDKYSDKLVPIPPKLLEELFKQGRDFAQFSDLKAIADKRPQDIYIFDYKRVHILMAKINKGYKLVFWERLENLIDSGQKTEPAYTPAKKTDDGKKN